jgi:hypothetical protein
MNALPVSNESRYSCEYLVKNRNIRMGIVEVTSSELRIANLVLYLNFLKLFIGATSLADTLGIITS